MTAIPPDPRPDLPVERGPQDVGVGAWVVEQKYAYLRQYLGAAREAMKKWPQRVYIDPFCATGRIQVRGEDFTRPGGAAEAWHALEAGPARWTRMLVGDIDADRANACAARLQALGAIATPFCGPAIDTVEQMIKAVPKGALCIAFLDPYNLALLDFGMLKALAGLRKVDLIVHFSTMDLHRNADMELDPTRLRFDATAPGWRDQEWAGTANKQTLAVSLEGYWRNLVEGLGLTRSSACPLITNDKGRGIYRLAFFARHDLPIKLWGDVARERNLSLF